MRDKDISLNHFLFSLENDMSWHRNVLKLLQGLLLKLSRQDRNEHWLLPGQKARFVTPPPLLDRIPVQSQRGVNHVITKCSFYPLSSSRVHFQHIPPPPPLWLGLWDCTQMQNPITDHSEPTSIPPRYRGTDTGTEPPAYAEGFTEKCLLTTKITGVMIGQHPAGKKRMRVRVHLLTEFW